MNTVKPTKISTLQFLLKFVVGCNAPKVHTPKYKYPCILELEDVHNR